MNRDSEDAIAAPGTKAGIFLSYRRASDQHLAGRLADHLENHFGDRAVFMDIDSIDAGADFVETIDEAVSNCAVLLAVIGPTWATVTGDNGAVRRLDDPNDFVVLEISTALSRQIPVIPILVDGAPMPTRGVLPKSIASLARRQAFALSAAEFGAHVDRLEERLETLLGSPHRGPLRIDRRTLFGIVGGAVSVAAVTITARRVLRTRSAPTLSWTFETADQIFSSPAIDGDSVFIASMDGSLHALDLRTGAERWRYQASDAITSSPAVSEGIVTVGSNDAQIHAVSAATGDLRWRFPVGDVVHSSPTIVDGLVYVGSRDARVYCVTLETGSEVWTFEGGDWFNSSPTVSEGVVFIGCRDNEVYALDAASGAKKWSYTTGGTVDSSAFVAGNTVWIGGDDQSVYAFDRSSGRLKWQRSVGGGVVSTPVIDGGALYVGCDDGFLYALDATTGRERWKYQTSGAIRSSPAVDGDTVYVGSRDRSVHAIDTVTGAPRWQYPTLGPIDDSSPNITNGRLHIGSLDGKLYSIEI